MANQIEAIYGGLNVFNYLYNRNCHQLIY